MPILMRLGTLILAIVLLTACGEGYAVEPARLNLVNATAESKAALTQEVSALLVQEGFEDLGRDDEMIALLKSGAEPNAPADPIVERLSREHTYLNQSRGLSVVLSDYSDASPAPEGDYTPKTLNFIEISLFETRPGGASPEGHRFFQRFLSVLRARFGEDIVVVNEPPPTDGTEYRRVTGVNKLATVVWWCIAFFLSLLITAPISRHLLGKTRLATLPKRAIFTALNAWLVTPVLLPATITVVMAPNALAFPWIYPELYSYRATFHLASFLCSFVLCAVASIMFVTNTHKRESMPA